MNPLVCVLCGLICPPQMSYPSKCMLNGDGPHIGPLSDRALLNAVYSYRKPAVPAEAVNEIRATEGGQWMYTPPRDMGPIEA